MSFEAYADKADVVVRVERDSELIREQRGNEKDRFLFHPIKASRRLPITAACRKVAQIGCDTGTFPSGKGCLFAGGSKNLTESRSGKCRHVRLQSQTCALAVSCRSSHLADQRGISVTLS